MKIALILVLVLSLTLAKPEAKPEVQKEDGAGMGTGKQDNIGKGLKESKYRPRLQIKSHMGMTYRMRDDILGMVEDAMQIYGCDCKEDIAEYTYRALEDEYRQNEAWTCVAGEDWHAMSDFNKKILIKHLDGDLYVFCFV